MPELAFASRTLPLLERVAAFTERRHDVLTGNIANVSTPGYRARDLPVSAFQEALRQAVERRPPEEQSASLFPAGERRPTLADLFPQRLFHGEERKSGDLTFQDAGNRSVEREVMEMTKNSLMQNYAVELMIAQFRMLELVVNERA